MNPKILIGCPTYSKYKNRVDKYLSALKNLDYDNYDLLLVDNSKDGSYFNELKEKGINVIKVPYSEPARKRIVESRNILREKALEGNYDYFFSLEQDVIVNTDTLKKLLAHNLPIVSAYYGNNLLLTLRNRETKELSKVMVNIPKIYLKEGDKIRKANPQEVLGKGLIEAGAFGVGCLLISKKVLEKIKFRYEEEKKAFDDMFFCIDAKKLGYKLYVDGNVSVEHLHEKWEGITK